MTEYFKAQGRLAFASIIISGLLIVSLGSWSCRNRTEPITIGLPTSAPAFTPIYVARSQGFLARNGLEVTIRKYDVGLAAIDGILKGEVNVAGASEYPIVGVR